MWFSSSKYRRRGGLCSTTRLSAGLFICQLSVIAITQKLVVDEFIWTVLEGCSTWQVTSDYCCGNPTRDVHGNEIPLGISFPCTWMRFPMGPGIPWKSHGNGNKIQYWEWEWEGMGNHLSGNGNYLHSHGNLFPKVLCCDELIKLLVLF